MLNRVHRNARPRSDIYIPMVQRMGQFIKPRYMKCAMYPIEMKTGPNDKKGEHQEKPDQIIWEEKRRRIAIRHRPKCHHLGTRPECDPACDSPKHIIQNLISERVGPVIRCRLAFVEFRMQALTFPLIKPPM